MEQFAKRWQHIQSTLEQRAISDLEQTQQARRVELERVACLDRDRHTATEHIPVQTTGAQWHSLHEYLEAIRVRSQQHQAQAQTLSEVADAQRDRVLSVHREVQKWEHASETLRVVRQFADQTTEQRTADDRAAMRWEGGKA